ncbi:10012_t:CDS:2 [Entrophospora sp. SA101]|nr:10012_t:CDS:2 [Entrophospora sp. SA101]CAJ0823828.1 19251_t:CDS:2 [Entrophospora sp. SA101]CAJ0890106.1 6653_t:CDS:2 [Entrophospora sp. SA101]
MKKTKQHVDKEANKKTAIFMMSSSATCKQEGHSRSTSKKCKSPNWFVKKQTIKDTTIYRVVITVKMGFNSFLAVPELHNVIEDAVERMRLIIAGASRLTQALIIYCVENNIPQLCKLAHYVARAWNSSWGRPPGV